MTKHSVSRIDNNHVQYRGFLITTEKNWHDCYIRPNLTVQSRTRKGMLLMIDSYLAKYYPK